MFEILIKDIRELLSSDYDFQINISSVGLDVIFGEECFEDNAVIVTYGFEDFAYLNLEQMKLIDINYGFDLNELNTIQSIVKYLEDNRDYIMKLIKNFK